MKTSIRWITALAKNADHGRFDRKGAQLLESPCRLRKGAKVLSLALMLCFGLARPATAQSLINIDCGVGRVSAKTGFAATGQATNDFWNLYRHYAPKFLPGMPLVADSRLDNLKFADGSDSRVSLAVANAPGVWGNASGDPMFDTFIFSQNGSNITATLTGLEPGRYHFYLYGHADPDVTGEQNSVFTLRSGTNTVGPLTQLGSTGWKASSPWQERCQYVVFRDVVVTANTPVVIDVAPGPNGVAVLNGIQIISRGTSPPRRQMAAAAPSGPLNTNLLFRSISYTGHVSDTEARFGVTFEVESLSTNEISSPLFEGDVALFAPKLPEALRIVSSAGRSRLFCAAPGSYTVSLDLVAKITRAEPWNQITFTGPAAPVAIIKAEAAGAGVEMQFLGGTQFDSHGATNSSVSGLLGSDGAVNMRWKGRVAEVVRRSLVTVDTAAIAQVSPTVIKFTTTLNYEILQAPVPRLTLSLPASQALTKLQGQQIRDWKIEPGTNDAALLTIEFIKPVEKSYSLTVFTEQPVELAPHTVTLDPPRPLEVERESGSFSLAVDDTQAEIASAAGLRQVNAPAGALAAYRFSSRPFKLETRLRRVEPVLKLADRATVRVEESRVAVSHALDLAVEKAGIYGVEFAVPSGFVVADVRGEGIEDWKVTGNALKLTFSSRVLGVRRLDVQLEQSYRQIPPSVTVQPLGLAGATNYTVCIGAASSPGIRLKTQELSGLREMSIGALSQRRDELLAFTGEAADWKLTFTTEKLTPRVVSEVFNLITVGDGLVGGSATIRYGIINQGVQEFRVAVPVHWRNVEFTGANIRRRELSTNGNNAVWTIALQDKAWGGYTLVVTYDYQFDPKGATLDIGGAHTLDVERETGSLGIMTAANLRLESSAPADPLRRIDESELSETDRSLCTRPLLLAYKFDAPGWKHTLQVTRFEEVKGLAAVADRTELISVITEEGQMLTQASFMVKNNEMQAQRFTLPKGAELWSTFVNNQPAKPERDGDAIIVSLPRGLNRDQAFSVDIVYKQSVDMSSSLLPRRLVLDAPGTDVPNTYAEWSLFVPASKRLGGFEGNMTVAQGTTYGLYDAWQECLQFYWALVERNVGAIIFLIVIGVLGGLVFAAVRRGFRRALEVVLVLGIVAILSAMLLPSLSRAKSKAQRINALNNLKQIGLAARIWSGDNGDRMPSSFEDMRAELGTDKITTDPGTGQRFIWVGAGKDASDPTALLAYSPNDVNGRAVLLADGSVQLVNSEKFNEMLARDQLNMQTRMAQPTMVAGGVRAAGPASRPNMFDAVQHRGAVSLAAAPPINSAGPVADQSEPPRVYASSGAGGGGMVSPEPVMPAAAKPAALPAAATVAGIRPIKIDVPRTGHQFNFTKVLNARIEPLRISAGVLSLKTWRGYQMVLQVAMFLTGLALFWRQQRAPLRSAFWLAVAVALAISGVASLLLMWRLLGMAMIALVPFLLLLGLGAAVWRLRLWRQAHRPPPLPVTEGAASTTAVISLAVLSACLALGQGAFAQEAAGTNEASVVSAVYNGAIQEKVARLDVTLTVLSAATNQTLPLFEDDIAVQSFSSTAGAKLVREGRKISVSLPARGSATLQFKLLARLGGDVSRRSLAFALPPALSSEMKLVIDEADADVDCPTAVAFKRATSSSQTSVEAVLGATDRFEMTWTPRVKGAAETAATVFCQNTTLVSFSAGVIKERTTLEYQVTQGELKTLRVGLPAGHRVLRVEGAGVRNWESTPGDGAETLTVELLKGMSPGCSLTLETERVLEPLPTLVRVGIPHALEVKRETGLVGLRGGDDLALSTDRTGDLQQVDPAEFARPAGVPAEGLHSAFRFLNPRFDLAVRMDAVQPQVEAAVRNDFHIGFERLALTAQVEYTIRKAGVFTLLLTIPSGYRLDGVTGRNVLQWSERDVDGRRVLEVAMKERTIGAQTLQLSLSRSWKEVPGTLDLAGVLPLGAAKLTSFVTVVTEVGIAARTVAFNGLTDVPFGTIAPRLPASQSGSALAFKTPGTDPSVAPWQLSVATEGVEAWVRAETLNVFSFTDVLVNGRALVKYDIANAPVKEFHVRLPAGATNVEISGVGIRRRDQQGDDWRIELQNKVRGDFILTVTWEQPESARTNRVSLAGLEALGVERESGTVLLVAKPPLQLTEKAVGEQLSRVDVGEVPSWSGSPPDSAVLAYRYVRPGWRLAVEPRRYAGAEVLSALVDSAQLTTVVGDDGQMMTEMDLNIRNNGRQHLEIELPEGAVNWSAFVAGEPVRPSLRQGRLLLPIVRTASGDEPIAVQLTFVGECRFPKRSGLVALASPKLDVPLKNVRWDLYLPPDYDYTGFGGTMGRLPEAGASVVQTSFSRGMYSEQEESKAERQKLAISQELSTVKAQIAGGKLREAVGNFNRAKTPVSQNAYSGYVSGEIDQLTREVKRIQGSNLINAQNAWFIENNARLNAASEAGSLASAPGQTDGDMDVAGAQWEKLEAAQQLAVTRVTPLRVNLPTRGLRYSFTQVLQTEVNKAMTVSLAAENTRLPSWTQRLGIAVLAFLALWGLMAWRVKRVAA
jgi:type II secretory pathway pseudopilin PulG